MAFSLSLFLSAYVIARVLIVLFYVTNIHNFTLSRMYATCHSYPQPISLLKSVWILTWSAKLITSASASFVAFWRSRWRKRTVQGWVVQGERKRRRGERGEERGVRGKWRGELEEGERGGRARNRGWCVVSSMWCTHTDKRQHWSLGLSCTRPAAQGK